MARSLRDIPGANAPRRRIASKRDVFAPTRSPLLDLTPRGLPLDRSRRSLFRPHRQLDVGRVVLTLAALGVAAWLGTAFWSATRVEVSVDGLVSGAQLTPDDAAGLGIAIQIPEPDERFRAVVRVDGTVLDSDAIPFEGDTLVLEPDELVEAELVETALDEGEHEIEVSVSRLFLGDSRFRWTYVVDSVAPQLDVPATLDPVPIDQAVTVAGTVEESATLSFDGQPLDHDDGRFEVAFDHPPSGPLHFEAVDEAGNRIEAITVVPVSYPASSRAVHVSAAAWGDDDLRAHVLDLLDRQLIDAVQLDLKDEAGVIGYDSQIALARRAGAVRPELDLEEAVATLESHGARVIGRIVAFRDPIYARHAWEQGRHDEVLQEPDGGMLSAYGGFTNYAHPAVRAYNLAIALEAVEAGVQDILWDYIRRPEGHPSSMVVPGLDGPSSIVVAEFLAEAHDELRRRGAYQGASVFGIAAIHGDAIAQDVPTIARVVDYLAPMIYPSHWGPGQFGVGSPINEPYEITKRSLTEFQRVAEGSGARFLPWLQDFDLHGVAYGPAEVRAQIDAAAELGIDGFLLWNAQVRYTPEALSPIP